MNTEPKSFNVANNIVNGYYVFTALWSTFVPSAMQCMDTFETFIWEWDYESKKRGKMLRQIYHTGYENTAIKFHFRFCRTLAYRQYIKFNKTR